MNSSNKILSPNLEALGVIPQPYDLADDSKPYVNKNHIVIGFDTEYVSGGGDTDGKTNLVLSYQTYSVVPATGRTWFWAAEVKGSRLSLENVVQKSLMAGKLERKFHEWPKIVTLAIHYSTADLTSLNNFSELKTQLDGVRKTYVSLLDPIDLEIYDDHRNFHKMQVVVRDTVLLAPAIGSGLAKLGDTIGLPKLEMSKDDIKDLRALKEANPRKFWAYAMRDAEISALYFLRILGAAQKMLGTENVDPITLGSLAPLLVFKIWEDEDINNHAVLGTELIETTITNCYGKTRTKMQEVDLVKKKQFNDIAAEGYFGGRNEAFYYGLSPVGNWCDLDLKGAYVTAMGCIGMPKWHELRLVKSLDEMVPDVMGVAHVSFSFPQSVRYPCIPIRAKTGLIFPRTGTGWVTSPELWLARKLGAEVTLSGPDSEETAITGFVLEMDFSVLPFDIVARFINDKRAANKIASPMMANLYKQLGNSIYGKTAQAVKPKKVFDTRTGEMKKLPPSRISNAYLALYTTGLVRAVMGEILNSIPQEYSVISATTDGFLTDFPEGRMDELCLGQISEMFKASMRRVCGDPTILEIKHRPERVLCFRTRGQATLHSDGKPPLAPVLPDEEATNKVVLAKGGIKITAANTFDSNEQLVKMFIERQPGQQYKIERMRGFREIYRGNGELDLNTIGRSIKYTMDFDWKRRPADSGENSDLGSLQLWFNTVPIESLDEYMRYRKAWETFVKTDNTILKREGDLKNFLDYLSVYTPLVHRTKACGNAVDTAKKAFLRAYTQQAWGLVRELKNKELSIVLTEQGYPTSVRDVENAQRRSSKLLKHCVAPTEEVLKFLGVVKKITPEFPIKRITTAVSD